MTCPGVRACAGCAARVLFEDSCGLAQRLPTISRLNSLPFHVGILTLVDCVASKTLFYRESTFKSEYGFEWRFIRPGRLSTN